MKSIAPSKEAYGLPEREKGVFTNFVRRRLGQVPVGITTTGEHP